jgi:4-amino-4-deoxy-L-arabinose transferase-like glycosyltransferase
MTPSPDLRSPIYPLLLLLSWALLTLPTLGLAPLFDYDETVYAQTALDMMHHGQWIVPTANGMQFFEKPPFTYYLMDLSFKLFGDNAFAARLPSAIFTLLTAWVLMAAGTRLKDRRFGLMAAAIFLSMLEVALLAHAAILDAVLNFFIAAALVSYAVWIRTGSPRLAYAMAAAMGAAVSVKGPVGAVVPLLVMGLDRLWAGDVRGCVGRFPWLPCLGLFLLTATPWYLLILIKNGPAFLYDFIVVQNIGRALHPMQGHGGGWSYYIVVFLVSCLPWIGWLPAYFHRAFAGTGTGHETDQSLLRLSVVWVLAVIVLFSFAQTKLPHYISCIYPALALGLAALLYAEKDDGLSTGVIRGLSLAVLLPVGLAVTALPWIYPLLTHLVHNPRAMAIVAQPITPSPIIAVAGIAVLVALAAVLFGRQQTLPWLAVRFIVLGLVLQTALLVGVGGFAGRLLQTPTMDIAARIRQLPPDVPVFSFELNAPSVSFYAGRNYRMESDVPALARRLQPPYALVLRSDSAARLAGLPLPPPVYDRGGYMLYIVNAPSGKS